MGQPDIHVIAMLTNAHVGNFFHRINHALVEQETNHHGLQMDRGAHKGCPDRTVQSQGNGSLGNGISVQGFSFSHTNLQVSNWLMRFDHGNS